MNRVLILCTGNSCRSQMAEGWWRALGQGEWEPHSAGSKPAGYVHPLAVAVMQEKGVDLTAAESKALDGFLGRPIDLVITVCDNARESCPTFPGARTVLHWPFEDPADATGTDEEKLSVFRTVRDQIEARIRRYLETGQ